MNRWTVLLAAMLMTTLVALGCSGGGGDPVTPTAEPEMTLGASSHGANTQTHLWGFYDVYFDFASKTVEAVPNREVMTTWNVVSFLNSPPSNLEFIINGTPTDPGGTWIDVDIDVKITHPIPQSEYDGYDVRGVFIGDGSLVSKYDSSLARAQPGVDQTMNDYNETADPYLCGNPDGYTRWWNPDEFLTGVDVLGYWEGAYSTPGYEGTAEINPYKYFADGLGACDDLWGFLTTTGGHGVFTAGHHNTRNYYLRFPTPDPNVVYNYAVTASWIDETTHPANAPEAVGANIVVTPNLWNDGSGSGGNLILDIDLFGWALEPSAVYVESSVLNTVHNVTTNVWHPIGGGYTYSTIHVDIPADTVGPAGWTEDYMVILEYQELDYTNEFSVLNDAGTDFLAAFFGGALEISPIPLNEPPVCDLVVVTSMPVGDWAPVAVEFDASGSTDPDGDPLTFEWDFDGDTVFGDAYDSGTDDNPIKNYNADYVGDVCVKVSDGQGGQDTCCQPVDITAWQSKNIDVTHGSNDAWDLALDPDRGDVLVLYANGDVKRYRRAEGYSAATAGTLNTGFNFTSIDHGENDYWMCAYVWASGYKYPRQRSFRYDTGTTNDVLHANLRSWGTYMGSCVWGVDSMCIRDSGGWANRHVFTSAYLYGGNGYNFRRNWWTYPTSYSSGSGYILYQYYVTAGLGYLKWDWTMGFEGDPTGDYYWSIEDPDYYAERYSLNGLGYTSRYWGTGSPDNDDTGCAEAKDITCGESNHFYVLDYCDQGSGFEYRLKGFISDGSAGDGTTELASILIDMTGDPIRIDATALDAPDGPLLAALSVDGSDAYISIYNAAETP